MLTPALLFHKQVMNVFQTTLLDYEIRVFWVTSSPSTNILMLSLSWCNPSIAHKPFQEGGQMNRQRALECRGQGVKYSVMSAGVAGV